MSDKYKDLASDWVDATEKCKEVGADLQEAQDAWQVAYAAISEIEKNLGEAIKVGNDMPPTRVFVVGYSYEKKAVFVSRVNGYTSIQLVKIEDA